MMYKRGSQKLQYAESVLINKIEVNNNVTHLEIPENIYVLKPKSWLIDCLRRRVVQFRIVMTASYNTQRKRI